MSLNKVTLIGYLGNDPDVNHTRTGKQVVNLSVATSENWKDKMTGERRERTEWHRVVIFEGLAGIAAQYLRKGAQVYLEGKLQTRKWTDSDGKDRYSTEVVLSGFGDKLLMMGRREGGSGGASASKRQSDRSQAPANAPAPVMDPELDDEIPF